METTSTPRQKRMAMLAMVIAATLWSTGGFLIKLIPWNPLFIAGGRSLISAGVTYLMMRCLKIRPKLNKQVALAAFCLLVCLGGYVTANKFTTAANAIMLQYNAPIMILVLSALILKRPMQKKQIIAVSLTTIGIVLFFLDQLSPGGIFGNIVAVIAGVGYGGFMLCIQETGDDDAMRYSSIFYGHLLTAAVGLPACLFSPPELSLTPCLALLALGVFQLGIPYVLVGVASKHSSALANTMIGMLEPILNPIWVALLVGEKPGFFALIGGAIIIGTVTVWCIIESREGSQNAA